MLFKRKKILDFREYIPDSTLKTDQSIIFKNYSIIDSHVHLGPKYLGEDFLRRYKINEFVGMLKKNGVVHAIDLEIFSGDYLEDVLTLTKGYEDFFSFCAPINLSDFEKRFFEENVRGYMMSIAENKNICGFKIWKDLGLSLRRKNQKLAKLHDPEFDVIWKTCEYLQLPVVIHIADPIAFFQKADSRNERLEELLKYPMWDYSKQTEVSHSELIAQFAHVLQINPKTNFVAAHLINSASDLSRVEEMLTEYPNLYVDIAAVLAEIGRQPRSFYKFAEKFQDRILFGTDSFGGDPPYYPYYKRFLETDDEYFEYRPGNDLSQGRWRIYGCHLSDDILNKIYHDNAKKIFGLR